MPKPSYNISPLVLNELKKEVLKMALFPVRTKSDAGYLALLMKRMGIDNVSESTILRFLNQPENDHKFYLHTLDKFAIFCGKKDFDDFEKWSKNNQEFAFSFGQLPIKEKPIKSLINICVHQNQLKPLHEYTDQLNNLDIDSQLLLGFELYISLFNNKNSNLKFFKEFSHVKAVREGFFERCTDPDFKINGYAKGYEYYLQNTNPELGEKQLQDYVFGNCILLRHYFINSNYTQALKYSKPLYEYFELSEPMLNQLFIYPRMRYLAYELFYLKLKNNKDKLLNSVKQLLDYCKIHLKNWDYVEQRIAFSCVAEAFIHTRINEKYHDELKQVFSALLTGYSPDFLEHSLSYVLRYTDMNGIRTYKNMAGF
jgi:hypothetical protein